jgi:hypothetical protein
MPLQLRRGNTAEVGSITPLVGELVYDTQIKRLVIGVGTTAGGVPVVGVTINDAKDAAAASLLAGTHQNVSFTYNSTTKALSARVDILVHDTIEADSIITSSIRNNASTVVFNLDTGTLTANILTNNIDSADSSEIVVTPDLRCLATIRAENEFQGRLVGNVEGNVNGDLFGNIRSLAGNRSYDRDLNVYYPNGLSFVGSASITSLNETLLFDINTVAFNSDSFSVNKEGYTGSSPWLQIAQFHNTADADNLTFTRARGTIAAPTAVVNGDDIIDIAFSGYDGSTFRVAGALTFTVSDVVSSNVVPTRLSIQTHGTTAGSVATRVTIDSSKVAFNVVPQIPTFADQTAADSAIGTLANGMLYYDTALGKIRGRAGGVWVDLH